MSLERNEAVFLSFTDEKFPKETKNRINSLMPCCEFSAENERVCWKTLQPGHYLSESGPWRTHEGNFCKIHKENVFFKPNFSVSAVSPSIAHSFPFTRLFPFAFDSHVCFFFTSLPRRHFFSRPEKEIAVRIPLNFFIRRSTPLCKLDYAARSAEVGSGEGLLPNLFRERSCAHSPDKEGVKNRLHTFAFATSFHRQELSNLSVGELSRIAAFAQFLQL